MGLILKKDYVLQDLGCANCANEIEVRVQKISGINYASVNFMSKTLTIEIKNANKFSEILSEIKSVVKEVEPDVEVKEKRSDTAINKTLLLSSLDCANCAGTIEDEVKKIKGVESASLDFTSRRLVLIIKNKDDVFKIVNQITTIVKDIEPEVNVVELTDALKNINNELNDDDDDDNVDTESKAFKNKGIRLGLSAGFYVLAIITTLIHTPVPVSVVLFLISYLLSGGTVLTKAVKNIFKGRVFDENFLMSVATLGAFAINQFEEGVAVMLFFQLGMYLQNVASNHSRKSIAALMDIRPDFANLKVGNDIKIVSPKDIEIEDVIIVKPGEKVPLDGIVIEGKSMVDTSALTGESVPREVEVGNDILGGFINKNGLLTVKVTKEFGESTVSRILELVQNASSKKAPTENFISKFARYYTPIVTISALLIAIVPPLLLGASFNSWVYRALVFLVVSCPCALVISIPLGFFGGIGGASKCGVLIKGSNYLEALNDVDTVVFDKTGTLTKGVFKVTKISPIGNLTDKEILEFASYAESQSNHPIAISILKAFDKKLDSNIIQSYEEISGYGIKINITGKEILVGNYKLMEKESIGYEKAKEVGTILYVAVNRKFEGYIVISDEVKEDSATAIKALKDIGVKKIVMLTGDSSSVATKIAEQLGLDEVYSDLLPDQKVEILEKLDREKLTKGRLIFVGDGINDAPVLARADVGVAMGGLGSDAAIEAADVVLMTDEPSKLISAIKIAKRTRMIVWQNIIFALGVKVVVLLLGVIGLATMWEAVFADVGVALIAVLNAMRVMRVSKI